MTEQTTGNEPQDVGDAAQAVTGTPDADSRDAGTEPDYKALHLASKSKLERINDVERENQELREALAQQNPNQTPAGNGTGYEDDEYEEDPDVYEARGFAQRNDPVAKLAIRQQKELQALRKENRKIVEAVARSLEIRDVPEDERPEVQSHYLKNRTRGIDIKAARAEVRERKLASENENLRRQLAAMSKEPPKDVIRTHSQAVPASEAKLRTMTFAEFDREQAMLKSQGRFSEAMARQRELNSGKLDLVE